MNEETRHIPLPEDYQPKTPAKPASIDGRIDLVRKYLINPAIWPDGLDWPNWQQPHELWFTGHEQWWIHHALELQKKLDAQENLKSTSAKLPPKPRRSFFGKPKEEPPAPSNKEQAIRLAVMYANAQTILKTTGDKPPATKSGDKVETGDKVKSDKVTLSPSDKVPDTPIEAKMGRPPSKTISAKSAKRRAQRAARAQTHTHRK